MNNATHRTVSLYAYLKFGLLLALLCSAFAFENNDRSKLFPMPDEIKPNVDFWVKVYAVYASHQVLIHDAERLNIIYEILDLNKYYPEDAKISLKTKWKHVDRVRERYQTILRGLARKLGTSQALTYDEERVMHLFPPSERTPNSFYRAARNIRGQLGLKDRFAEGLKRSGLYRNKILEIFKKHNLPLELAILPHVESEFNYKAYSKAGAAGLWQFTRRTGRLFMRISYDVDERFDPVKATESAARLLKKNYELLGSWPLAITAYNHGPNGMKRAKSRHGDDIGRIIQDYKSRSFGFASRNFYAEFLAALHVVENYKTYFGEIEFDRPIDYLTFKTDKYYSVKTILRTFDLSLEEFKLHNPALRSPVLSGKRRIPKGYLLHIPDRPGLDEKSLWASISPSEQFNEQVFTDWYKVRRGDNLSLIARRLGTTIEALVVYNNLDDAHHIYVGQILRVPQKGEAVASARETEPKALVADAGKDVLPDRAADRPAPGPVGESTAGESDPVDTFEPTDGLATPDDIVPPPGMRVELAPDENGSYILLPAKEAALAMVSTVATPLPRKPQEVISEWITVEPEETLGHYAEWLEVSANTLRKLNGLSYGEEIRIGQKLRLTFDRVPAQEFQRRRLEYQQSIEEDFFAAWRVEGIRTHTVRRGQSIWYITNTLYDVPLWLVARYNPGVNLQDLHIGDQLNIPIVVEILQRAPDDDP